MPQNFFQATLIAGKYTISVLFFDVRLYFSFGLAVASMKNRCGCGLCTFNSLGMV
jgi:hypothetical protein